MHNRYQCYFYYVCIYLEVLFLFKSQLFADGVLGAGVGHSQAGALGHVLSHEEPTQKITSL